VLLVIGAVELYWQCYWW